MRPKRNSFVSPAKLNLFLQVTGKREDGYHLIDSVFMPFDAVTDKITVEFGAPGIELKCPSGGAPEDSSNLVWKAAKLYAERSGTAPEWRIELKKSIPAAAGMGGGSSDAAGVLRLLNSEYRRLSETELAATALELGADVPFFLSPGFARVGGIGEKIALLPELKRLPPVAAVHPGFPISAKWAYSHLRPRPAPDPEDLIRALNREDWKAAAALMHNDLEFAILEKFPLLRLIGEAMRKFTGMKPMVTGSGSAIFTLCEDGDQRNALRKSLKTTFDGIRVI
ncbi:MAG: 4-(cytidine 5'-diphospho)-2-C-methyl-D-erythritol kinase [Victivallaceae bacterium]|nr:4-(cytidine 5'-diphospho)-2-C-methyl-D-erythritol kinase [Victivallaceae bacterium]